MYKNESGVALVLTLFVIVILITLSCVFVLRTINERSATLREVNASKAFYISEAGSNVALDNLDTFINEYMRETINFMSNSAVEKMFDDLTEGTYDSLNFLADNVKNNGNAVLTLDGSQVEYSISSTTFGDGTYSVEMIITEKSSAISGETNKWDFFYNYRITATGVVDDVSRIVILRGDFTVRSQKDTFAKYALFTNEQKSQSGSSIWFTGNANFDGPVHTNDRFNFALNPSGTFNNKITQAESSARFYNNNFPVLLDADSNGTKDVPTFNDDFERGVDSITLSSLTQKQELIDQVDAGSTFVSDGVYLPNDGSALSGGIYIKGNSAISVSVDGSDNAVYEVTQGGTTYEITVDRTANQTSIYDGSSTTTYSGLPDGVDDVGTTIYSENNITSLSGEIQRDTNLTISSDNDIYIQGNLVYSDYTAAQGTIGDSEYVSPAADDTTNIMGIVSWTGDVYIGASAPDNVNIHGTILAKEGVFTVEDYDDSGVGSRGTVTLLGGVITNQYGAFGTFNGSSGESVSGYGRNFVYDKRMLKGNNPPYFPSLDLYTAFSSDVADKVVWQEGDI